MKPTIKSAIITAAVFVAATAVFIKVATPAYAGLWDDFRDAVSGHVTDIKDRVLNDEVVIDGIVVKTSEFRKDDIGRDNIHWANGSVSAVVSDGKLYLQLGEDFEAGLAPDLHIYVANAKVVDEKTFWDAETIEISKLSRSKGATAYEIHQMSMYQSHLEVVIWCKRFGAFIAAATLIGE